MHKGLLARLAAMLVILAPASAGAQQARPDAPSDEDREWAQRDRMLSEPMSLSGGTGLLRTQHAQGGAPGQVRLGFSTEYFTASFLCTFEFPCLDRAGRRVAGDTMNHIGGTLALGVTALRLGAGALEGYASTTAVANSSDVNRPGLLQVLGDTTFGAKAYGPVARTLHVGGFVELMLVNGTGAVGLSGSGTSARFGPAVTVDLRELQSRFPLRVSTNVAYTLDNRGEVVTATEVARAAPITRIERFGLNINRVDHVDLHVGTELFLAQERVRPFVEVGMMIPVNRQNYLCRLRNPSGDACLANRAIPSSRLTVGGRFYPWRHGLALTAAIDLGMTHTTAFIEEMAPVAPWTLHIGASYAFDTKDRPPRVETRTIEKAVEVVERLAGRVHGTVREKDKAGSSVPDAVVAYADHADWTSMATNAEGVFVTRELGDGTHKFFVKAQGYKDGTCEVVVPKGAEEIRATCELEAMPRFGNVVGRVKDAESGDAVAGANVRLSDGRGKEMTVASDAQGGFRFESVPPGTVTASIDAPDYLASSATTDVKVRQDNPLDLVVRKRPKNALVTLGKSEITIKQQVQFANDSAVILPASFGLLTEVADVFIKNPRVKRVEIQGHTDNTGSPERNKKLSEERASAVRQWLVSHGVGEGRLVARGYGQEKPVAPNVTPTMRARNRRVQFVIQEQDAAAKGGAPTLDY